MSREIMSSKIRIRKIMCRKMLSRKIMCRKLMCRKIINSECLSRTPHLSTNCSTAGLKAATAAAALGSMERLIQLSSLQWVKGQK